VQRLDVAVRRLTWMGRDDADLRSRLGTLKLERGDISAALEDFERSIELEPNPLAWLNIGVMREREGRAQRALEAYEAALLLAPDDVTALFYAGRASFRIGDAERAQALLTKAAEGAPERRDIRRLLDSVTRSVPAASSVQERGG
jgi:tetratricopeptide (TPR) repeat protein